MTQDAERMEMPLTHIERMDLKAQENAHALDLAKVAAQARVGIEREKTRQQRLQLIRDKDVLPWCGWMGAIVVIASVLSFAVWGIHHLSTSGPPKSIEQVQIEKKQDRWEDCVSDSDNVWYPQAYDNQGVCVKRGDAIPK